MLDWSTTGPAVGAAFLASLVEVVEAFTIVLLLLFGIGWLRKAALRAGSVIPLDDEDAIFASQTADLSSEVQRHETSQDWIAGIAAFKAVLLEGLKVVFIVIAVSAGRGLL